MKEEYLLFIKTTRGWPDRNAELPILTALGAGLGNRGAPIAKRLFVSGELVF
jgi:hypothetical protein